MSSCSCATGTTGCCCSGSEPLASRACSSTSSPSSSSRSSTEPSTRRSSACRAPSSTSAGTTSTRPSPSSSPTSGTSRLNRTWTFRTSKHARWWHEYWPFLAVGLLGQVIGLVLLTLLMHLDSPIHLSPTVLDDSTGFRTRLYWAQAHRHRRRHPRLVRAQQACGPSPPCAPTTPTSPIPATSRRCSPTRARSLPEPSDADRRAGAVPGRHDPLG